MRPLAGMVAGALLAQAPAAAAQEEALRLPSGLEARLFEVVSDRPSGGGLIYRFRYVADGFTAVAERFDAISGDLVWLCETHALPRISNIGPQPGQVVVSLADRESEFGVYDEAVTQVFEAYRIENDRCTWEMF
ncbi:DUF6497 family protein [Roseovarius nitratireducens]|uniref:DUF6497 family protein n=1 Tax=Roseovarius nitratireducens TaxID=2044597 RepID=UPI001F0BC2C7|nr:DUF6497 family protein [Roseovarius nitratireducens]